MFVRGVEWKTNSLIRNGRKVDGLRRDIKRLSVGTTGSPVVKTTFECRG